MVLVRQSWYVRATTEATDGIRIFQLANSATFDRETSLAPCRKEECSNEDESPLDYDELDSDSTTKFVKKVRTTRRRTPPELEVTYSWVDVNTIAHRTGEDRYPVLESGMTGNKRYT